MLKNSTLFCIKNRDFHLNAKKLTSRIYVYKTAPLFCINKRFLHSNTKKLTSCWKFRVICSNYVWSLYVILLLDGEFASQNVKSVSLFLLQFFFLLSFSLPLLGTLCASFPHKLPIRSQWNFKCTLVGREWIAVQNIIDLTDDLNLLRSQLYKITLWAISRFLLDKLSSNLFIMETSIYTGTFYLSCWLCQTMLPKFDLTLGSNPWHLDPIMTEHFIHLRNFKPKTSFCSWSAWLLWYGIASQDYSIIFSFSPYNVTWSLIIM